MRAKKGAPDFAIILSVMLLISIGIIMVFSASAVTSDQVLGDPYFYLKRQIVWAALGTVAMFTAMKVDYLRLKKIVNPIFVSCVILLVLVLLVGDARKGSSRWLGVGSLSFQPSETIKLGMVMFLSRLLSTKQEKIKSFSQGVLPVLVLLGIVCGLILAQPDLGTAVAIAGTTYFLLMAAGAKFSHLSLLAVVGMVLVALAIYLAPYRMERFTAFLNPWADPTDSGFQTIQSLLALGSGGLFGVGLGASRQKLFYLPEKHTDFIFAIIGEELGFIGGALILLLFLLFVWRGFKVAITSPDSFSSLLAAGITTMIALQAIINIGVVTGSLPVTGITLPFISYGGSSLIFTMAAVGLLLNISRYSASK
ncbi:stage V sporulation protein E [Zhaonella formicivorans]|uniref:stage V sporulation protein E n=1 Tax=Zhaonella formicivorans TaxID=2528593 RepID=UPI0010F1263A|nr:stage V sporulation protein E [Zhaonella formicivorans]